MNKGYINKCEEEDKKNITVLDREIIVKRDFIYACWHP
jgi:hypothetical protein